MAVLTKSQSDCEREQMLQRATEQADQALNDGQACFRRLPKRYVRHQDTYSHHLWAAK